MRLLRALVGHAFKQRAVLAGLICFVLSFMVLSYLTWSPWGQERRVLDALERGAATIDLQCEPSGCAYPTVCASEINGCYGVNISSEEVRALSAMSANERLTAVRSMASRQFAKQVFKKEQGLSMRGLVRLRAASASAGVGAFFAVLIAATLLGRDWRWAAWPTILSHESRRARILAAKLASAVVVVLTGSIVAVAATLVMDGFMTSRVESLGRGGPSIGVLVGQMGWSALILSVYTLLASAAVMVFRSTLPGIVAPFALLAADTVFSTRTESVFRHFLPAQSIGALTHPASLLQFSRVMWVNPTPGKPVCREIASYGTFCNSDALPFIPSWRAVLILVAWGLLAYVIARAAIVHRDIA